MQGAHAGPKTSIGSFGGVRRFNRSTPISGSANRSRVVSSGAAPITRTTSSCGTAPLPGHEQQIVDVAAGLRRDRDPHSAALVEPALRGLLGGFLTLAVNIIIGKDGDDPGEPRTVHP